jgi:hypothetical protein
MTCRTLVKVSWTELCASFIRESKILECDTTLNCYSNVYGEFRNARKGRLAIIDLINKCTNNVRLQCEICGFQGSDCENYNRVL